MLYVWFVIAGAFAGVSAGLFGVGGGMIIVPALVWIFTAYHFPPWSGDSFGDWHFLGDHRCDFD